MVITIYNICIFKQDMQIIEKIKLQNKLDILIY